jgi:hypothetical protein
MEEHYERQLVCAMPNPKDVFDNPDKYWALITSLSDEGFEGQYFDRKEVGRVGENGFVSPSALNRVKNQIVECISGFANASGGLVIVGISRIGEIKDIRHLTEAQVNGLTSIHQLLRKQAVNLRPVECQNCDSSG